MVEYISSQTFQQRIAILLYDRNVQFKIIQLSIQRKQNNQIDNNHIRTIDTIQQNPIAAVLLYQLRSKLN